MNLEIGVFSTHFEDEDQPLAVYDSDNRMLYKVEPSSIVLLGGIMESPEYNLFLELQEPPTEEDEFELEDITFTSVIPTYQIYKFNPHAKPGVKDPHIPIAEFTLGKDEGAYVYYPQKNKYIPTTHALGLVADSTIYKLDPSDPNIFIEVGETDYLKEHKHLTPDQLLELKLAAACAVALLGVNYLETDGVDV